jgi:cytochrome c-type biogenesis protein CcmH
MRQIVKKRILEGDTNDEIINYMRRQYGDFVLLKPPFQINTLALWILPFMLIVASGAWFFKAKK